MLSVSSSSIVIIFLIRVISDRLFLREFVFSVCMFCFIFVSRLILLILKIFCGLMTFAQSKLAIDWRLFPALVELTKFCNLSFPLLSDFVRKTC